jgi:hypothetical protein
MATLVLGVSASSAADFQAALNAALAPLLTNSIVAVQINVGDASQVNGIEYSAVITYTDGAPSITAPFTCIVVEGRTAADVAAQAESVIAASPALWWSNVFAGYEVNDGRRTRPYSGILFSNVDPANAANWQVGGAGGAGGTYVNTNLMPSPVGGYPAGTSFPTPKTWQEMFDGLLYPYTAPTFTSFQDSGVPNPLEVGATIAAAATFTWGTSTPSNITPNSISIQDLTRAVTLGSGLPNSGSFAVTMPGGPIQYVTAASHSFRINGVDVQSNPFNRTATYVWQWRKYWGQSGAGVPSGAQITGLANSALSTSYAGTYVMGAGGFKFICQADAAGGQINLVKDQLTGFNVPMATVADDPAYSNVDGGGTSYALVSVTNVNGVTTNYRVYRTANSLGGAITLIVT